MTKKILHLQIPTMENSKVRDNLAVNPELLGQFMKIIQEKLPEFIVVSSPCEPSILSEKDSLFNFKMDQITIEELKKIIEK